MSSTYKVVFKYDGKEPWFFIKPKIEKLFIEAYRLFCDMVNPMFEKWNNEYDGPNDGFEDNSCYNRYINECQKPAIDCLNEQISALKDQNIKRFFSDNECRFCAELNNGTILSFYLVEQ